MHKTKLNHQIIPNWCAPIPIITFQHIIYTIGFTDPKTALYWVTKYIWIYSVHLQYCTYETIPFHHGNYSIADKIKSAVNLLCKWNNFWKWNNFVPHDFIPCSYLGYKKVPNLNLPPSPLLVATLLFWKCLYSIIV